MIDIFIKTFEWQKVTRIIAFFVFFCVLLVSPSGMQASEGEKVLVDEENYSRGTLESEKEYGVVDMRVEMLSDFKGFVLKSEKPGLGLLNFFNVTKTQLTLPLHNSYGKGVEKRLLGLRDASYCDENNICAGLEVATIEYTFLDSEGREVLRKKTILGLLDEWSSLSMAVGGDITVWFSIDVPEKKGVYSFKMIFDNRNVEKAIWSHNALDPRVKYVFLRKEIVLQNIVVE